MRISNKSSNRIIITGSLIASVSILVLMLNIGNAYNKAINNKDCVFVKNHCDLRSNNLTNHLGVIFFSIGLMVTLIGLVLLLISEKKSK